MQDAIKRGNGRSRFMKADIPDNITWEQFRALLRSGAMPFDMGINESTDPVTGGWEQFGTKLTKNNLLSNEACSYLGLDSFDDPTISKAFLRVPHKASARGVTFTAAGWTGTGPYTQTVEMFGLTHGALGFVGLYATATKAQREAARDAQLFAPLNEAHYVTLIADGVKPSVDLPIYVLEVY